MVIDPIRGDDGQPIGFAKITRDITERVETQRSLDLAREALFQSQKLEAIGQLTGGVAHDFNNLLMAILGSLELVRKRLPDDPKVVGLIDNAVLGAKRGAALTQRMLAFARKQELKLEPVDLRALVEGMTGLLQGSLGPSIRIETRLPPGLPPAYSDPNQLETAVLNLAVNARDAMSQGGMITIGALPVRVAPGADLPPGDYVRLSVTDTGQGMDAETAARAAEPFYTTKGVGKGTGLGLSMVHGLTEQSGGRLKISSRPGVGTVVELWLRQASGGSAGHAAAPVAADFTDQAGAPLTVLAVDDDALVLMNTIAMLEDLGHRALCATGAKEALALLKHEAVDLVVTDYAMPQMTGVQLAEAVAMQHPGTPVILATGYAELPPGATSDLPRLPKPFLMQDLAGAIRQMAAKTPTG